MVMVVVRTHEQRMAALERGNEVRVYRAVLKREMQAGGGPRGPREVLEAPVWQEETWKVIDLLLALPKVGRVKAHTALRRLAISPSKTVAGLTDRQRQGLLEALEPVRDGWRMVA